jgi:hypothetical protein
VSKCVVMTGKRWDGTFQGVSIARLSPRRHARSREKRRPTRNPASIKKKLEWSHSMRLVTIGVGVGMSSSLVRCRYKVGPRKLGDCSAAV